MRSAAVETTDGAKPWLRSTGGIKEQDLACGGAIGGIKEQDLACGGAIENKRQRLRFVAAGSASLPKGWQQHYQLLTMNTTTTTDPILCNVIVRVERGDLMGSELAILRVSQGRHEIDAWIWGDKARFVYEHALPGQKLRIIGKVIPGNEDDDPKIEVCLILGR